MCTYEKLINEFRYENLSPKPRKFDSNMLNTLFITPYLTQVLVGMLLGDANIRKPGKNGQPQIQYNQGFVHLNHILHIFFLIYIRGREFYI